MASNSDPLVPAAPPPPPEPRGRAKMVCEFCQCELGADGSYKALSETARTYRDMKEKNERLAETNAVLQREKEELERKVREMTPTPAARRESLRL